MTDDQFTVDGIFDAKLIRENKSAKGIFLTLEIAADDYFAARLSDVRPGALLKIGYQEIIDVSVQPIEVEVIKPAPENNAKVIAPKPKRAFASLSLPEQAGIRCSDGDFKDFLDITHDRRLDESIAGAVRRICGVASRSELSTNAKAAAKWEELESMYQIYLLDQRYPAETRR